MNRLSNIRRIRDDQRGYTLIETLVAMFSAVVVVGALYAILDMSVSQTARVTNMVQASQAGRVTMAKIDEELNSACIASKFSPVKEGMEKPFEKPAEESKLVFVNAYVPNSKAEVTSAVRREIIWKKSTGLLVEKQYESNGGSWPEFAYPTATTGEKRLGEDISEVKTKEEVAGKTVEKEVPIFQYYKYRTASTTTKEEGVLTTLEKIKLTTKGTEGYLTEAQTKEASAVEINFNQSPNNKYTAEDRAVDFKTQVTLSLSVPDAETPIEEKPCE
jgi:type II secretory pathway pseudopilin PulG